MLIEKTQKKLLYQAQRIFEFGDKTSRLLAYLAHSQQAPTSISRILDANMKQCTSQIDTADAILTFYTELYTSKGGLWDGGGTGVFSPNTPIRAHGRGGAGELDSPFTTEEVISAIRSLKPNKTPGLDGLPVEWYGTYAEILAPKLMVMYEDAYDRGILPESMREAFIVLIPKPHKDHDLCESYRPISLINVDTKILAKLLAKRLNKVIASIIHPDQTGFIPKRSTVINLRRLFTILQSKGPALDTRVVVSLDTQSVRFHRMAILDCGPWAAGLQLKIHKTS